MKKNTVRKRIPMSMVVEEDRLYSIIDKLEFDLELSNRKNILLESNVKGQIKRNDAIVEKKLSGKIAAQENAKLRASMELAKDRAFAQLKNDADACLPFKNSAQVVKMYDNTCKMEGTCACSHLCEVITKSLPTVKRYVKGIARKANIQASRSVSKGMITISVEGTKVQSFKGDNWKAVSKEMREYFIQDTRLTVSQIAGFTHKGPANKYEAIFNG